MKSKFLFIFVVISLLTTLVSLVSAKGLRQTSDILSSPWRGGGTNSSLPPDEQQVVLLSGDEPTSPTTYQSLSNEKEIVIKTHVFVIYKRDGTGRIDPDVIEEQMKILQDAFQGKKSSYPECNENGIPKFTYQETTATPFRFQKEVRYLSSNEGFNMESKRGKRLRQSLHQGNCGDLNIFFGNSSHAGKAYSPRNCNNMIPQKVKKDGVYVHYDFVPGGRSSSQGDTLVHEVGHWLGLSHTFEGGCDVEDSDNGDKVDDTPNHQDKGWSCTVGNDSCPNMVGMDPIHNYMSYSPDCCMYQFTPGQVKRMIDQAIEFRGLTFKPSPAPTFNPSVAPLKTPPRYLLSNDTSNELF